MCRCDFDLPARERELAQLREQAQSPDLWDDQNQAQRVMKGVARLESLLATWQDLEAKSRDLQALLELAEEAGDEGQADLAEEALIGWDSRILGEDDQPIAFSAQAKTTFLNIPYVRAAVVSAFIDMSNGRNAARKNSR